MTLPSERLNLCNPFDLRYRFDGDYYQLQKSQLIFVILPIIIGLSLLEFFFK